MTDEELTAIEEALNESTMPYPEVPEWIPWESGPVDMPLKAADVRALVAEVKQLQQACLSSYLYIACNEDSLRHSRRAAMIAMLKDVGADKVPPPGGPTPWQYEK